MHVTLRKNMLISLFISEGLGHQWQVKVSTKLIVIKTDSSFQSASESTFQWQDRYVDKYLTRLIYDPLNVMIPILIRAQGQVRVASSEVTTLY